MQLGAVQPRGDRVDEAPVQDAPSHGRDRILRVGVEVEAEPLAAVAVARAPQLDRQLERLHEARRADDQVVVERAPARVRVLVAEQPLACEQGRVLGEVLAVHDQVLPVHVDLDVLDPLRTQLVDHVQGHADVAHEDVHGGLGVLVLEEQLHAVGAAALGGLADPVHEPGPALAVGRLERVVVALDPGPDDEMGAELAGKVDGLQRAPHRLRPCRRIGRDEAALAEARVEVEAGRQAVDVVAVERLTHRVQVLGVQLLRVVELVAVDQVAEPVDRAPHALHGRLLRQLRLVAAGDEAGRHRPEGPDA